MGCFICFILIISLVISFVEMRELFFIYLIIACKEVREFSLGCINNFFKDYFLELDVECEIMCIKTYGKINLITMEITTLVTTMEMMGMVSLH